MADKHEDISGDLGDKIKQELSIDKFIRGEGFDISNELASRFLTEIKAGENPVAYMDDDGQVYARYDEVQLISRNGYAEISLHFSGMRICEFHLEIGQLWKLEGIAGKVPLDYVALSAEPSKPEPSHD